MELVNIVPRKIDESIYSFEPFRNSWSVAGERLGLYNTRKVKRKKKGAGSSAGAAGAAKKARRNTRRKRRGSSRPAV